MNNVPGSIVERSLKWQEQKEKKTKAMIVQKELKEQNNEDLTFKPQINRAKPRQAPGPVNNKGMDKYMEKINKAKKLKEEKAELEKKVFGTGRNWTNKVTEPNAPNLTVKKNSYVDGGDNFNEIDEYQQ